MARVVNSVLPLFVWLAIIHGLVEFSPLRPGEYWLLKLQPAAPLSDELTPSTRWGWFRQLGSHAAAIGILMLLLAGRNLLDPTARHFTAISLRLAWPWFILLTMGLHVAVDLGTRLLFRLLCGSPDPTHYAWAFTLSQAVHYATLYYLAAFTVEPGPVLITDWTSGRDWTNLLSPMLPGQVHCAFSRAGRPPVCRVLPRRHPVQPHTRHYRLSGLAVAGQCPSSPSRLTRFHRTSFAAPIALDRTSQSSRRGRMPPALSRPSSPAGGSALPIRTPTRNPALRDGEVRLPSSPG